MKTMPMLKPATLARLLALPLLLACAALPATRANDVLTWTNGVGDFTWFTPLNWSNAGGAALFTAGDIVNLAGFAPGSIQLGSDATVAGMYVSGTSSYAITGAGALVANAGVGDLISNPAATSQLVLGKNVADTISPPALTTFTGTLDLTGQAPGVANNFMGGVEINSGVLRISNASQLGAQLSKLNFLGAAGATGSARAILQIAANTALTFDGVSGSDNRLIISPTNAANIIVENSSTLAFSNNAFYGSGGAMEIGGTASLTIEAGANSLVKFYNNQAGVGSAAATDSGAINLLASATLILTATNGGGFLFDSNKVVSTGGSRRGGAIQAAASTYLLINTATFTNNASPGNGGAVNVPGNGSTTNLANILFLSNTAGAGAGNSGLGGGLFLNGNASSLLTVRSSTFIANVASNGGGFGAQAGVFNFIDVSFLNNTALNANANAAGGGAIHMASDNTSGTITVTAGKTSQIAGNTAGGVPNSVLISNNNNLVLAINTETNANLDMLDPMFDRVANGQSQPLGTQITKTGAGTWNLGGSSTFIPANANPNAGALVTFTVAEGTLHLYRAGETSASPYAPDATAYTATTGNITYINTVNALGSLNFIVNTGATLSAGGGNIITTGTTILQTNATIALDLAAALPDSTPILTLNARTDSLLTNNWTQKLDLLNLDLLATSADFTLATGDTFNLITLGNGNLFADANLKSFTEITGLLDDYTLKLSDDHATLQLLYAPAVFTNSVLTWNGLADNLSWAGANWTSGANTDATFNKGDIINITDTGIAGGANTINIDTLTTATIAGMYLSGTENTTLTGRATVADAAATTLTGSAAATGKLILGAKASDDAGALDTASADYTGTLTLNNTSNDFTGGIEINNGALVGNAARLGSGTAGITIAAPGSLTFDQAATGTYAAPIRGSGALVKTNTAALTLTADSSSFAGTTDIVTGTLRLATAAALGGAINIHPLATLAGAHNATAGALGSMVTLDTGATLQVGLTTTATETFSILGNLTLNDGSHLTYTSLDNTLLVGGNIFQTGATTINLAVTTLFTGSYNLIDVTGAGGLTGFDTSLLGVNFKGDLLELGAAYTFTTDGGLLWLNILTVDITDNSVITWTGASGNSLWLTGTNWTGPAGPRIYVPGDIVNLTDTPAPVSATITLARTATVAAMYVNGAQNYTLTGSGAIIADNTIGELTTGTAATGKLTLGKNADDADTITTTAFTGTLDLTALTGTNNFKNGVEINTGALRISTAAQLGTGLSKLAFTGTLGSPDTPTLQIAANSNVTFSGAPSGTNNRLVIAPATAAALILEDNAKLTFSDNNHTASGGAIAVGANASLTLTAAPGAQYIFTSNTLSAADAAAIATSSNATLLLTASSSAALDTFLFENNYIYGTTANSRRGAAVFASDTSSITIDHATFRGNYTTGNGGAVGAITSATLTLSSILFASNTASASNGGAIFINTDARAIVRASTFQDNSANQGGAIAIQTRAILTVNDSLFLSNTASTNGGAINFIDTSSNSIVTTSTFRNNTTATGNGGAIAITAATSTLTLNDASFYDNTAGADGGAISVGGANSALIYNITAGNTSQIAGNKATRGPGIFISNGANESLTINTDAGATLDQLDPLFAAMSNNSTDTITKTGAGTWKLGGSSTITPNGTGVGANFNFTVAQGTLHLYRAGQATYNGVDVATGNITFVNTTAGATFGFALNPGATLSAGGGNSITANSITLASNARLILDLANSAPSTTGYSVLTLNPIGTTPLLDPGSWGQQLTLLNLDQLAATANNGDAYNLITLTGPGNTFANTTSFNLLTTLPSGFTLQLGNGNTILQLLVSGLVTTNNVLTWTNAAANNLWTGANWNASNAPALFRNGDIINLANSGADTGSTSINNNTPAGATLAAMYVSGTENYTITGAPITTTSTAGSLAGAPAATGKLILGAKASDNAGSIDTTSADAAFTGTLTLSNTANNFTGGIEINSGALVGNAARLGSGDAGITIGSAATLTFQQNPAATYDSAIRGSGALNKTGTGALTLAANNSAFTGQTTVDTGALLLGDGASLGGNVDVHDTATFGGAGRATTVTLDTGAALQVGLAGADPATPQTLSLTSLSLADGSFLNYTNILNTLLVSGAITQTGTSTINLGLVTSGSHTLIDITGGLASFDTSLFDINYRGMALESGVDYLFGTTGNQVWIDILNISLGNNTILTWTGAAANNLWLTGANWKNADGPRSFAAGDIVNFDGTAPATITLSNNVTLAAMYLSGTASYALAGDASITADPNATELSGNAAANGKLVLGQTASDANTVALAAFTGTLDLTRLTGSNNFQNGVEIHSGALRISTADQLGTTLSKLTLAGDPADATAPATLQIAANSAITFDSAGASTNRLVIPASSSADFLVEDGATLTFTNNAYASGSGGVILVNPGASLTLAAGINSNYIFTGNTSGFDGGVIWVGTGGTLALTAAEGAGFLFDNNKITGGTGNRRGSAIFGTQAGTLITINSATFSNNSSPANGGAIAAIQGARLELQNVLFTSNTGANGGAILLITNAVGVINSATFQNNYATTLGGAITIQGVSTLTVTDALFANNSSANTGGAINMSEAGSSLTLNNVSFLNNTTGTNGGAIFMSSANTALTINVDPGVTSQFAGNKANGNPNAIYLSNNNNYQLYFNVADNATLDMLDPIYDYVANGQTSTEIVKFGAGTWKLGGDTTFTYANANPNAGALVNITIAEGTLHLYRNGDTSGNYTAPTGNILLSNTLATLPSAVNLTIKSAATLSAGGGNTITLTNITFEAGATIALDLADAIADSPSLLTLNAKTFTTSDWAQNIALLNFELLDPIFGDTFNLITLGGGNTFLSADSFAISDQTPIPDGFLLTLTDNNDTLSLICLDPTLKNRVLTWTGAIGDGLLTGANWTALTPTGTSMEILPSNFHKGSVLNLTGYPIVQSEPDPVDPLDPNAQPPAALPQPITLNINTSVPAIIAGLNLSGTDNYTITGNALITDGIIGTLAGAPVANGKLTLGALALDDASALDTTATFTGTLTLNNSGNLFTGGIDILSGALVGNAVRLNSGTTAATGLHIATDGTLYFNQTTAATYATPITGDGTLVKNGGGALSLSSPYTNFTGATQINAGSLILANAGASYLGDIHVSTGVTFGGIGAAGNITLDTAATLQIGLNSDDFGATLPSFNVGDLTLANGAYLNYVNLETPLIHSGTLTTSGAVYINISDFKFATYHLGNLAALAADATVTINNSPQPDDARHKAILSADGDELLLNGVGDPNRVMTWSGIANNTWQPTTGDWINSATTVFANGDQVHFDDTSATAPRGIIVYSKGVTASDMYVNGTSSYIFTGGAITTDADSTFTGTVIGIDTWTGKLYKAGTGTLALNNLSNNFIGGIDLAEGTILFTGAATNITTAGASSTVAPGATLQFAGATLDAANLVFAANPDSASAPAPAAYAMASAAALTSLDTTSTIAGYGRITGAITLNGIVAADIPMSGTTMRILTISATTTGPGAFLKTGLGTLTLNGPASLANTGTTQIDQGIVSLAGISGVTGNGTFVMPQNIVPYTLTATTASWITPSATYTIGDTQITLPDMVENWSGPTIGNATTFVLPSEIYIVDGVTYIIGSATSTVSADRTQVTTTERTVTSLGINTASTINASFTLNGGTLALNGSGAFTEDGANDWKGLNLIQGENAADSAITGTSDMIYLGAGAFAPSLQNGLIIIANPGDGNTTLLSNTTNTFAGAVRVDSGTLQVTAIEQLGSIAATGAKIILNNAAVHFSDASMTTTGNMEVRGADNTINVDDGLTVEWGAIAKGAAPASIYPATYALAKVGTGTFSLTGALGATELNVTEGRWIAKNVAGAPVAGMVNVSENAVFELAATANAASTNSYAATQPYMAIAGSVRGGFAGSGTLLVSTGRYTFSSPNIDIATINIAGPTTAVNFAAAGPQAKVSPNGTITVDQGMMILGATNQDVGNVVLNGGATLAFLKNATVVAAGTLLYPSLIPAHYENNVLIPERLLPSGTNIPSYTKIDGNGFKNATIASLKTDGSTAKLWFNVNLAEGMGDHLTITGAATGDYIVGIANSGPIPSKYTAPIDLIQTAEGSDATFTPLIPEFDLGLFKYKVAFDTSPAGAVSLRVIGTGAMSNSANLINQMAAMMPMSFFSELDSVTQRMGELRFENREVGDNTSGFGTWMRGYGDRVNYNSNVTGSPFNETIYGGEAGLDYKLGANDHRLYAGLFMGYGWAQRGYGVEGDGSVDSVNSGGYLTYSAKSGWYADGVLKLNTFKNRLNAVSPTGERMTVFYNNWALGGSLELGKYHELDYGWYVTPQIQAAHTVMQGLTYATDSGMSVSLGSGAVTRGRIGVMVGRIIETSRHGTIQYYFKAYGGGQWTTGNKIDILFADQRAHYASTIKGYNFEGGVGLSWLYNKTSQVYFDYDTTSAEYYVKPWSLNLGIRRMW